MRLFVKTVGKLTVFKDRVQKTEKFENARDYMKNIFMNISSRFQEAKHIVLWYVFKKYLWKKIRDALNKEII